MKRKEIISKLIKEGFSEKTLASLNDKQLNALSSRILKEQYNDNDNPVNIPKTDVDAITQAKQNDKQFVAYEGEMTEDKDDDKKEESIVIKRIKHKIEHCKNEKKKETFKNLLKRVQDGKVKPSSVEIGEEEKPKFAKLQEGQHIASITFEEAMDLFKLPREVGNYEDVEMVVAIGRFGPYVRHNSLFFSIPKGEDPYTILGDRCIEIIEAKRKADREKVIQTFDEQPELQVLKGRWGPYIKMGKNNYKIPKDKEAASLTIDECLDIIDKAPPPRKRKK
jgi:topoisomerase IA-like protein